MANNRAYYKQVLKGFRQLINENPDTITVSRINSFVDDGTGNLVPDPFASPVDVSIKCRVSHERVGPFDDDESTAGLSTDLSRFILVDKDNKVFKDETFTLDSVEWRIGPVDQLEKFGKVYGYQAPLIKFV